LTAETAPIARVSEAGCPLPTIRSAFPEVSTVTDRPLTVTLLPSRLTLTLFCWTTVACAQADVALAATETVTITIAPAACLIRSNRLARPGRSVR
jgi:hypothetical protein